ncbi:MAG TPA: hypothetical protein VFV95_21170 [Vicinamibacterales bacterium]|nr:hypothetical protein [Vicinamibacterales bacterium]
MVRLALAILVGVFALTGSVSAQYPELNELQLAKQELRKAQQALSAAMTARLQPRQAGVTEQQASRAERQAYQQVQAATEKVRQLRAQVVPLKSCVLPDETAHPVDATVTFQGQTLRCVIVLDRDLKPSDVAWSPSSTRQ